MKTSVVETARVLETDGNYATVMVEQGTSCKGCGMAKLGMCRPGGAGMVLKVRNPLNAGVGDRVKIGIDQRVHLKGYLLAFIIPLVCMFLGAIGGSLTGLKGADVVGGFLFLGLSAYYCFRRLNSLDRNYRMYIKGIEDRVYPGTHNSAS